MPGFVTGDLVDQLLILLANPGTRQLTGSAWLDVGSSDEDGSPISPLTYRVEREQPLNSSIHHWKLHLHELYHGQNAEQRRPNYSWVLPSSGQTPFEDFHPHIFFPFSQKAEVPLLVIKKAELSYTSQHRCCATEAWMDTLFRLSS